jgi:hypothetical protein
VIAEDEFETEEADDEGVFEDWSEFFCAFETSSFVINEPSFPEALISEPLKVLSLFKM